MVAGQAEFTDFVDMTKTSMSAALGALTVTSLCYVVTVVQGNTVSFGCKQRNS